MEWQLQVITNEICWWNRNKGLCFFWSLPCLTSTQQLFKNLPCYLQVGAYSSTFLSTWLSGSDYINVQYSPSLAAAVTKHTARMNTQTSRGVISDKKPGWPEILIMNCKPQRKTATGTGHHLQGSVCIEASPCDSCPFDGYIRAHRVSGREFCLPLQLSLSKKNHMRTVHWILRAPRQHISGITSRTIISGPKRQFNSRHPNISNQMLYLISLGLNNSYIKALYKMHHLQHSYFTSLTYFFLCN